RDLRLATGRAVRAFTFTLLALAIGLVDAVVILGALGDQAALGRLDDGASPERHVAHGGHPVPLGVLGGLDGGWLLGPGADGEPDQQEQAGEERQGGKT